LSWITPFLVGRTAQVAYDGRLSSTRTVCFGVPQESVLGLLFFILYTAELSQVVVAHGLKLHQYADDCQVYATTLAAHAAATVDVFTTCVADVATHGCVSPAAFEPK